MSAAFMGYVPPGPVAARYMISEKLVAGIVGPQGSGKTGASINKILYRAMRQAPHPVTRRRQTRWLVARAKAIDLRDTVIKSWHRWVPEDLGTWKWGGSTEPASHHLEFDLPDGTIVECEVIFVGLDDENIERKLKGREITGAYINEADQLQRNAMMWLRGRLGRWPSVDKAVGFGGATWKGIFLDFNMTDDLHWLYEDFVEKGFKNYELFVQPAAMFEQPPRSGNYILNPKAENLENLPAGYYEDQIEGQDRWWIRRNVLNKWGANRDGEPVYPEYDDEFHTAARILDPIPGLRLKIGGDAGLMAAAVIGQETPSGQIRVLDEITAPDSGWGAVRFSKALMDLLLSERYRAWRESVPDWKRAIDAWGDPAAAARVATDEQTWMAVVRAQTGLPWRPAPTNSPELRQQAVRGPLMRNEGGQPSFLLSPHCKVLRRGFNSGYCFRIVDTGGRRIEEPNKNRFSHVHDAMQYVCVGGGGHMEALGRTANRSFQTGQTGRRQVIAITEDNPDGGWVEADYG